MSVHDAEPGDIYRDKGGQLWQVVGTCREPTVIVERLYKMDEAVARQGEMSRMSGGVGGLMWQGFTKLEERAK